MTRPELDGFNPTGGTQLTISDETDGDIELIYSRLELSNVYHNLLKNSLRAYEDAGLPVDERVVAVRSHVRDNFVIMEFEDQAKGISAEDLERVFDSDFTTKKPGEGKGGLGLRSCQIVLTQHHGRVEIESELGEGTIVRLALPIDKPD